MDVVVLFIEREIEVPGPHEQEEGWLHGDQSSSAQRQACTKRKE